MGKIVPITNAHAEDIAQDLLKDERKSRTVFRIPEERMGELTDKIESLNRRAKKLKCQPIETKVLNHFEQKVSSSELVDGGYRTFSRKLRYFTVEITGSSPIIPGWEFLGTLVHYEVANVLRAVPGKEIPDDFRHRGQMCDHCGKRRSRKDTYIVQNVETKEVKQVGHSCLKDFLGHVSPASLGFGAELLSTMTEMERESSWEKGLEAPAYLMAYLEMVAEIANTRGYVSKAASNKYAEKSGGTGLPVTSVVAWRYYRPTKDMILKGDTIEPSESAKAIAQAAVSDLLSSPATNSFEGNLQVVASREFVAKKDIGFASAIVGNYLKKQGLIMERTARAKAEKEQSEFFGTIGERGQFNLTVHNKIHLGTHRIHRGWQKDIYLYKMTDENGNVAVWKTDSHIEPGQTYDVKATVKGHCYYGENQVKQTVLTRVKVMPSKDAVSPVIQGEFDLTKGEK
nr:hypothetical protein BdHM001_34740 [Bdellovibrio sp. HM001]